MPPIAARPESVKLESFNAAIRSSQLRRMLPSVGKSDSVFTRSDRICSRAPVFFFGAENQRSRHFLVVVVDEFWHCRRAAI